MIWFLRNPTSIVSFYTYKNDQKNARDNEEQMMCASHKECAKNLNDIHVSKRDQNSFLAIQF